MLFVPALVLGTAAGAPPAANETHCGADFCTWWHGSAELNANLPVADENVRQSRRYLVLVGRAGAEQFVHSFAYEAIPRNGNGAILRPTDPPHSGTFNGSAGNVNGDGITVEQSLGVSMAWSQFEHAVDVDVKILPRDGAALGPASAVVVRPLSLGLRVRDSPDGGVLIQVPRPSETMHGLQFSVEFAADLHTYRSNGNGYVESGGSVVGIEPTNALLIFASPFLPTEALPPPAAARKVMRPGPIRQGDWGAAPVLHFPAGVYWLEPKGQSRILLDPATQWVHLDGGAFVKGAVEFTTQAPQFAATGHGVLSGEQYVYQANPLENWSSVKSDQDSLRMWRHNHVAAGQSLLLRGPTCSAPPFNSMDLFGFGSGSVHISDYKQVGAWWFQTDGPEMGTWELGGSNVFANGMHSPGSVVQDVFYHVNDDGLKLYSSNITVRNATVWKCHNDPILQMGWAVRDISNVSVAGLRVIHTRYNTLPNDVVPQAIIGVSNGGGVAQPNATLSAEISDVVCEGLCPALMHIAPLQSYQLTLRDIHFPDGLLSGPIGLGRSEVKGGAGEGVEVKMRLEIVDWTVGEQPVTMDNFQSDQLGQFDIAAQYWGQWRISTSARAGGSTGRWRGRHRARP